MTNIHRVCSKSEDETKTLAAQMAEDILPMTVIALFGVVHPGVWKPLGKHDQVIYKNIECSPCYKHTRKPECYEGDAECKRVIEVEDVLSAIERILRE